MKLLRVVTEYDKKSKSLVARITEFLKLDELLNKKTFLNSVRKEKIESITVEVVDSEDLEISKNSLDMIDESAKNLRESKAGKPIDFSEFSEIIEKNKV